MDRGAWRATVRRVTDPDMTEATQHGTAYKFRGLAGDTDIQLLDETVTDGKHEGTKSMGKTAGILTLILGLFRKAMLWAATSLRDNVVTCHITKIVDITSSY